MREEKKAAPAAVAVPSDDEIDSLVQKHFGWQLTVSEANHRAFAREVLAQWGAAPQPPVAAQEPAGQQDPIAWHSKQYGTCWLHIQPYHMQAGMQFFIRGRQEPVATVKSGACIVWHMATSELPHGTFFYPAPQPAPVAQGDALTDTYVQQVPDKCDRIVWRGRYYHLPIDAAEHSYTEPSPMAKVAAALRQKAEQEDAAYQARRSDQGLMESEWGPMEDAPPHEDPPMHVAVVEGDDTVRTLQWNRDVAAFAYPAGTLLYAARAQAKEGGAA